jgi:hypothetical protein
VVNEQLRVYVQDRLAGIVHSVDGTVVGPPTATWKGRNQPRRQDRRWATAWSPAQIANRLHAHHDVIHWSWAMSDPSGATVTARVDTAVIADDRIALLTGFFLL